MVLIRLGSLRVAQIMPLSLADKNIPAELCVDPSVLSCENIFFIVHYTILYLNPPYIILPVIGPQIIEASKLLPNG